MEDKYVVYAHVNKINGKMYIGQTKSVQDRWVPSGYYHCVKFYRAIQKYGWENFEHIILADNLTQEEANIQESYYIEKYNTIETGYNLSGGGNNKVRLDESSRKKLSDKSYALWQQDEFKNKQHDARISYWNSPAGLERKEKLAHAVESIEGFYRTTKIRCITTNQIFNSIKEAQECFGIKHHSGIVNCCRGKRKSAGRHPDTGEKLQWEYYKEDV